jgi:ABC-2 type transport system ATP-binding protein
MYQRRLVRPEASASILQSYCVCILLRCNGVDERREGVARIEAPVMLIARNLSKTYAGRAALKPLDLQIEPGEVFCLLGPNGAGKSTTIKLFLGFTRPSSGEALVDGTPVQRNPHAVRRLIAYVPEQVNIYPELSGAENLEYFAGLAGVPRLSGRQIDTLLDAVGLPPEARARRASTYSKGMRQKVALALSRAKGARALLLDEPTSGLDPGAVRDLCFGVRQESARGAAVLMVTHDLAAAASVASRIGILRAGQLMHVAAAPAFSEADLASLYRVALETEAMARDSAEALSS